MHLTGEQARLIAELSDGADCLITAQETVMTHVPVEFERIEDGLRGTIAPDGIFTHISGPDPADLGLTLKID